MFIYTNELHIHLFIFLVALFPFSFILMNCTCKGSSIPLDRGKWRQQGPEQCNATQIVMLELMDPLHTSTDPSQIQTVTDDTQETQPDRLLRPNDAFGEIRTSG